jgi:hypothetical protein
MPELHVLSVLVGERARPALCPPRETRREESPAVVDPLAPPSAGHVMHRAFEDEPGGRIRVLAGER